MADADCSVARNDGPPLPEHCFHVARPRCVRPALRIQTAARIRNVGTDNGTFAAKWTLTTFHSEPKRSRVEEPAVFPLGIVAGSLDFARDDRNAFIFVM